MMTFWTEILKLNEINVFKESYPIDIMVIDTKCLNTNLNLTSALTLIDAVLCALVQINNTFIFFTMRIYFWIEFFPPH